MLLKPTEPDTARGCHVTLASSEDYAPLINHMNENIDPFNLIVERRKSGGEADEVDPTVDTSMDTPAVFSPQFSVHSL